MFLLGFLRLTVSLVAEDWQHLVGHLLKNIGRFCSNLMKARLGIWRCICKET